MVAISTSMIAITRSIGSRHIPGTGARSSRRVRRGCIPRLCGLRHLWHLRHLRHHRRLRWRSSAVLAEHLDYARDLFNGKPLGGKSSHHLDRRIVGSKTIGLTTSSAQAYSGSNWLRRWWVGRRHSPVVYRLMSWLRGWRVRHARLHCRHGGGSRGHGRVTVGRGGDRGRGRHRCRRGHTRITLRCCCILSRNVGKCLENVGHGWRLWGCWLASNTQRRKEVGWRASRWCSRHIYRGDVVRALRMAHQHECHGAGIAIMAVSGEGNLLGRGAASRALKELSKGGGNV